MARRISWRFSPAHESTATITAQFAASDAIAFAPAYPLFARRPSLHVTCVRRGSDRATSNAKNTFARPLRIAIGSTLSLEISVYAVEQQWQSARFVPRLNNLPETLQAMTTSFPKSPIGARSRTMLCASTRSGKASSASGLLRVLMGAERP